MGMGYIEDILEAVERGVDFFDCVLPPEMPGTGLSLRVRAVYQLRIRNTKLIPVP